MYHHNGQVRYTTILTRFVQPDITLIILLGVYELTTTVP